MRRPVYGWFVLAVLIALKGCCGLPSPSILPLSESANRYSYPDLLDFKFVPKHPADASKNVFYDRGSWYGYSLPTDSSREHIASFPGPFMHDKRLWLSDQILRLELFYSTWLTSDSRAAGDSVRVLREETIDFSAADSISLYSLPGLLRQEVWIDSLYIVADLVFNEFRGDHAVVRYLITNRSKKKVRLTTRIAGKLFIKDYQFRIPDARSIAVTEEDGRTAFSINWQHGFWEDSRIELSDSSYVIAANREVLVGKSRSFGLEFYLVHNPGSDSKRAVKSFPDDDSTLHDNADIWQRYLRRTLVDADQPHREYRRAAVKSLQTLMLNYRHGYNYLEGYEGIIPSSSINYFNGFWAWDSWKHVVALSRIDSTLALEHLRDMLSFRDSNGMVADCVFPDSGENNWRDTKPPLAAWAATAVFSRDTTGISDVFPKLLAYHRWWYRFRDHDGNGLCEYGSADGTLEAARWESGMDDAVRFDNSRMLNNGPGAWSLAQESVDLNAYLYAEKKYLAGLAAMLGQEGLSDSLKRDAAELRDAINKRMFDNENGYYFDVKVGSEEFINVKGPEGWIPLWAGVAEPGHAQSVYRILTDTSTFATLVPFPTVAKDETGFMTGYWRGPVWLDQAYFAVAGLARYGFNREAREFAGQLLTRPEGIARNGVSIRENYHPLTGEGLRVHNFSWSAAHVLMLYWGLQGDTWY